MERPRRVAIVSGVSSGIGLAQAEVLLMEGRAALFRAASSAPISSRCGRRWQSFTVEGLGQWPFRTGRAPSEERARRARDNSGSSVGQPQGARNGPAWFHPGSSGVPQLSIDLAGQDAIVAKSGYYVTISFGSIGPRIVVDTPSISNCRPGLLPFMRRRPVYPEHTTPPPTFTA
ncbi:hypothetical protein ACVWYH_005811 [Bradyrhizobium sp. GM24.11]